MRNTKQLVGRAFLTWTSLIVQLSYVVNSAQAGPLQKQWPQIAELTLKVHFSAKDRSAFKQTIFSKSGDPLYILDARIPSDVNNDPDYDYSGVFDCRLYPINVVGVHYSTLLQNVRGATRDWQSDGRFLSSEIIGLAGSNGSRFLVQRSRLRGMSVTIEISNVIKDESTGEIASFDVCFLFRNDPLAVSDIAAPPAE